MNQLFLFIIKLFIRHSILDLIFDDFLSRDKKIYKKFSDIPFTGRIKSPNGKNKFWLITNYKDGLAHGLYQKFFQDGSIMHTGVYEKGNRTGKWNGYHPDGSFDYTITTIYEDGKDTFYHSCKQFENNKISY